MLESSKKLTDFQKGVYEITSKIPKGNIATYQQIAKILGSNYFARAVGNALHINPFDRNIVPCHRVIKSNGEVGGYAGGTVKKIKILENEGINIHNGRIDLKKYIVDSDKLRVK